MLGEASRLHSYSVFSTKTTQKPELIKLVLHLILQYEIRRLRPARQYKKTDF
jgi:hypothetical protein